MLSSNEEIINKQKTRLANNIIAAEEKASEDLYVRVNREADNETSEFLMQYRNSKGNISMSMSFSTM